MQHYFYNVADHLNLCIKTEETLLLNLTAEESTFIRFNNNQIRQAGQVKQSMLNLQLIQGQQHASAQCELMGDLHNDLGNLIKLLSQLRVQLHLLPSDPYLHFANSANNSEDIQSGNIPPIEQIVDTITATAESLDLVGIWASGTQSRGFANSLGQRNWFSVNNFNFDWSIYTGTDKAVKMNYAGMDWQPNTFKRKMQQCKESLKVLTTEPITLSPGQYRVYLAPSALEEIIGIVSWGGFGLKSHRTMQTPLLKMITENQMLHNKVNIIENHAGGITPRFTGQGFLNPDRVNLVQDGKYADCLCAARSAKEYNSEVNTDSEYPSSIDIAPGTLDEKEILRCLDTGIYINNLWYCNFSDRAACRITGMTRYACFWVENGNIVAPINVMRFDETLYNILGDKLLDLSKNRDFILDPGSYDFRSTASMHLPGALVEDFTLTL